MRVFKLIRSLFDINISRLSSNVFPIQEYVLENYGKIIRQSLSSLHSLISIPTNPPPLSPTKSKNHRDVGTTPVSLHSCNYTVLAFF